VRGYNGAMPLRSRSPSLHLQVFGVPKTVVDGRESFKELGRLVLWEGAQDIQFEATA